MKREFAFEDSLRMLEVLWSSLPVDPPMKELKLYDVKFQPPQISTPPISPLIKTPRENPYTKVCAIRRQSSSVSLVNYSVKKVPVVKRQNHSLDESLSGSSKNNCNNLEIKFKYQSLDDSHLNGSCKSASDSVKQRNTIDDTCDGNDNGVEHQKSSKSSKCEVRPRSVSPYEQKSDSVVLNNRINTQKLKGKSRSNSLSSSMTNLIKSTRKSGHFKELKERIVGNKLSMFSSLDTLDTTIKEECKPRGKMVKNLNEFLNFASVNKNKISDKFTRTQAGLENGKPKIMLTKSSLEDSESSSIDRNSSCVDKTRNSSTSNDDTFDECSPDDSQEYYPMTTAVTRELRIELENLDRQVFGNKYTEKFVDSDSPCSECNDTKSKCSCIISKGTSEINTTDTSTQIAEMSTTKLDLNLQGNGDAQKIKLRTDDVFIWQNPLHQSSPNIIKNLATSVRTPDEQADLEYDAELGHIVDEVSNTRTVTPIKILNGTCLTKSSPEVNSVELKIPTFQKSSQDEVINVNLECVKESDAQQMTNSCEEITEVVKPTSKLLPPPNEFGCGNPFLMFLCITVLLQHRDHIMNMGMDYNEMAMHFDKMVRKHNVTKVLNQARQMHARYIKQHTIAHQKVNAHGEEC